MPDPYVFGPDAAADRIGHAASRAELEAAAYARAYLAHGDQLAALEAEAYAHSLTPPLTPRPVRRALAGLYLLATGRPMRCPACRAPYHAHRGRACQW